MRGGISWFDVEWFTDGDEGWICVTDRVALGITNGNAASGDVRGGEAVNGDKPRSGSDEDMADDFFVLPEIGTSFVDGGFSFADGEDM